VFSHCAVRCGAMRCRVCGTLLPTSVQQTLSLIVLALTAALAALLVISMMVRRFPALLVCRRKRNPAGGELGLGAVSKDASKGRCAFCKRCGLRFDDTCPSPLPAALVSRATAGEIIKTRGAEILTTRSPRQCRSRHSILQFPQWSWRDPPHGRITWDFEGRFEST
jgi:hypothetical protein